MEAQVTNTFNFRLLSVIPSRDETGHTVTKLTFQDGERDPIDIEVPYSHMYSMLELGQIIQATLIGPNQYNIHFPFDKAAGPYIGTLITCPFCGNILIGLEEGELQNLFCFNPACETDPYRQLFFTFNNLNIVADYESLEFLFHYMTRYAITNMHLLNIFGFLDSLVTTMAIVPNGLRNIHLKLKLFLKNCRPSEFLRMLKIPPVYYEQIVIFDDMFGSVETFYEAMQNYRSMKLSLPTYDDNLMNLIYANLHLNQIYINQFFTQRNLAVSN